MSQGMERILSDRWFDTILPRMILAAFIPLLAFSIFTGWDAGTKTQCVNYSGRENMSRGVMQSQGLESARAFAAVFVCMDFLITIAFTALFLVPLYRVYNTDLGQMNASQKEQNKRVQAVFIWAGALTFINQITTTMGGLFYVFPSPFTVFLYYLGILDAPINVWTSWLMLRENRDRIATMCRCKRIAAFCRCIMRSSTGVKKKSDVRLAQTNRRPTEGTDLCTDAMTTGTDDVELQLGK